MKKLIQFIEHGGENIEPDGARHFSDNFNNFT